MTVTTENNAISIIHGFPWKHQEQVIKNATTLLIVGDTGTSPQCFDKFRCMKMTLDRGDIGMKYGEAVAISY